jgi:predicted AlkP superfamily pyrophosphatase or phosphodiesterase
VLSIQPSFNDGNLVNLMSAIASRFSIKLPYPPLKDLEIPELHDFTNVVLIVIDGLGYNYLKKNGKGTSLLQNTVGSLSTVFPATTASGISTICTGLAPQQHALTGWFMYMKEIEDVIRILPYTLAGEEDLLDFPIENFIDIKPLGVQLESSSAIVGDEIADSPYTRFMAGNANILSYTDLEDFFSIILDLLSNKKDHFIYAYWPVLDTVNHISGPSSDDSRMHFLEIDEGFEELLEQISNTNTIVITTSDHGFVDTNSSKRVSMDDHEELRSYLKLPLCGEPRASYCYVQEGVDEQFMEYIDSQLGHICDLYPSRELVANNWFGLFKPNKKLYERIGDYTLIAKENYYFEQRHSEKEPPNYLGLHGGISKEEMLIPLIIATG